jgi:serine phosphatase RsbU (regulator of sigma subunit)
VLYTDGLIEDRRYTVDRGLTELCEAIQSGHTNDPADLLEHILNADVGPNPRSDDVAILAVTLLTPPRET